jgi:hypothetical protein
MDFKKFFKISKPKLSYSKFSKLFLSFWIRRQQIIFITFFLSVAGLGIFFWYKNIYGFSWSEERKKEYNMTQGQQINLKEAEFKKVLEEIEKRKSNFESDSGQVRDIFKPYEGMKLE